MSPEFEHIVILLGFIFGLALTHLLTSVNNLIHALDRVRFSWLHALSMVLALVFFITNWLALWDMRRVPHCRIIDVLSYLFSTANQYFVCSLVSMRVPEEGDVDMVAFAERQTTPFLVAVAALHIMAMLSNYQLPERLSGHCPLVVAEPCHLAHVSADPGRDRLEASLANDGCRFALDPRFLRFHRLVYPAG